MITVTLQEAKARLNKLVEEAQAGEDIVLMRGSEIVATILPLSQEDVEITTKLTDSQAERFWEDVSKSTSNSFSSEKALMNHLKKSR